ncbi:LAMI_0D04346g1_1 [Lachancea mirantina]|uniref:ATP synthase subunit 5, mitochondrial n=1 Tax=Lachancea mirantina TaxID=1230905 RepID=A0A1G4JAF2_9SACH|nr:LAMI_0D04346g1_1 [Lachancea mirantina]
MFSRVFVRSLASAAKGVKPPVQLFGLDGTYATALFTAASKSSSIEGASKSLNDLAQLISKDNKLQTILSNPALSSIDRGVVVDTLAKSQKDLDTSVSNLLKVLGENNRLDLLSDVTSQFAKLTDAYKGLIQATVTTAQPLDSKLLKRVEKALSQSNLVGQGKTLKLENTVNPDIQGGLIVEIADRTIDLSIASKIQKLNQVLNESI